MLQTGMTLKGKYSYRILAKIGSGGASDVWLVCQGNSRRIHAMKSARPMGNNEEMVRVSFSVEKYVLCTLHMPEIPRLKDVFCADGLPVLVLDYVSGMSMDRYLRENGPMSEEKVIPVILSLCRVLRRMHAKGMVYRDLKPSNIMMRNDGCISLIDFGGVYCAKSPTEAGGLRMIGTPGYAAPELYQAEKYPDPRADIYSLGALMQVMRRGGIPGEVRPEDRLSQIIERCLRTDPDERYSSVDELIGELLPDKSSSHVRKFAAGNPYLSDRSPDSDPPEKSTVIFWRRAVKASLAVSIALTVSGLLSLWRVRALAEIRCADLLGRADESTDPAEKLELLNRAVNIPGCTDRDDIRMQMIRLCGEDGQLSEDEVCRLEEMAGDGSAEIFFETGRLYWYCSTCDEEDQQERADDAGTWFERAMASPSDAETEHEPVWRNAAEAYAEACCFYRYVASDVGDTSTDGAYRSFAGNLADIASYEAGRADGYAEAVLLTDIIVDAENVYRDQFRSDGVTEDELQAVRDLADLAGS